MSVSIRAIINGRDVSREKVLQWERRRAIKVSKKLGCNYSGNDLKTMRRLILERKCELGYNGIVKEMRKELAVSDVMSSLFARLSFGARRYCVAELVADQGCAGQFVEWFEERTKTNDEVSMIAGLPDHYVIRTNPDGSQEIIETNGGSPIAAHFHIDYQDLSSLRSSTDASFTHRLAGVARSSGGYPLGGVLHQFRDEGNGFRARLTVEFPLFILPTIVSGHQWHLAAEFSNWIEAAFA